MRKILSLLLASIICIAAVFALSGCIGRGAEECNKNGIDAFFPITRTPMTLDEAMNPDRAYENLSATAEQAFRLYKSAKAN